MIRRIGLAALLLLSMGITAQDDTDDDSGEALTASEVTFTTRPDPFGQMIQVGEGTLTNEGEDAYTDLTIFADLYDENEEVIGEGFGIMTNACGTGLPPDFALQPGHTQPFSLALDFYDQPAAIAHADVFIQATPTEPEPATTPELDHIRPIQQGEVVNVEWIDPNSFRFAVGCDSDVFTGHDWFRYTIDTDTITQIIHPARQQVTDALRQQLGLLDPLNYNHSFLTFSPTARRIVYQTDINELLTAEQDGSFKRLIYDSLGRYSLHGFVWMPEGRFLAYYFGAIGDPVRYFTASVEGQRISGDIVMNTPSLTIPGPSPDGSRVVITLAEADATGYYLSRTTSQNRELLFEAEPPGNNWPAPVYVPGITVDHADIYIARSVDGEARLQCFDLESRTLHDLSPLPLNLTDDDRAWMWLSPDGNTLALASNGLNGGLWLVGVASLGGCVNEAE